jgi:hypothetical protein
MFRRAERLAVIPLDDPMGARHVRRVVSGDVTVAFFSPLPPRRFMLRQQCVNTRGLRLESRNRLLDLFLLGALPVCDGRLSRLISCGMRRQ